MPLAAAMHNTAASTVLAKYQAFLGGSGSGFCCFLPRGAGAAGCGSSGAVRAASAPNSSITSGNTHGYPDGYHRLCQIAAQRQHDWGHAGSVPAPFPAPQVGRHQQQPGGQAKNAGRQQLSRYSLCAA